MIVWRPHCAGEVTWHRPQGECVMSEVTPIDSSKLKVTITEVDEVDRRLDVEIPAEVVSLFIENLALSKVQINAQGIRSLLLEFCKNEALVRLDDEPVFGPVLLPDSTVPIQEPGKPFQVTFLCDVSPKISWPDFSQFSIVRPVREVTEEMIEAEILSQRIEAGERSIHDGALEIFDEFEGSIRVFDRMKGEDDILSIDTVTLRLPPQGSSVLIGGQTFSGISDAVLGRSIGDTVTLETTMTRGAKLAELEGTPVTMEIVIKKTWRTTMASVEDVLAKYGTPNESVLRQQIKFSLAERIKVDQKGAMVSQVFDILLKKLNVPIPSRIITSELKRKTELFRKNLEDAGESPDRIELLLKENTKALHGNVKRHISAFVITRLLAIENQIGVGESDYTEHIAALAANQGRRPEELRREIIDAKGLGPFREEIMKRKIAEILFDRISITDMDADEWNMTLGAHGN